MSELWGTVHATNSWSVRKAGTETDLEDDSGEGCTTTTTEGDDRRQSYRYKENVKGSIHMGNVKTKKKRTVEEMEREFAELAQEIYRAGSRRIQPTWPWVLIRVVPKEQIYGGVYLPDSGRAGAGQNKPLHEGIVLETWKPHWSRIQVPGCEYKDERKVWRESDFKVGDRVLFPSFAGLPAGQYFDEYNYRMIREWTFDPSGGAMCIVHYDGDFAMKQRLNEVFKDTYSVTTSGR